MDFYNPDKTVSAYGDMVSQQLALLRLEFENMKDESDAKKAAYERGIDEKIELLRAESKSIIESCKADTEAHLKILRDDSDKRYLKKKTVVYVLRFLIPAIIMLTGFLLHLGIKIEERSHEISTSITEIKTNLGIQDKHDLH